MSRIVRCTTLEGVGVREWDTDDRMRGCVPSDRDTDRRNQTNQLTNVCLCRGRVIRLELFIVAWRGTLQRVVVRGRRFFVIASPSLPALGCRHAPQEFGRERLFLSLLPSLRLFALLVVQWEEGGGVSGIG